MPDKGYEFFEHTADVGMRGSALTLRELFDRTAHAVTALLANMSS